VKAEGLVRIKAAEASTWRGGSAESPPMKCTFNFRRRFVGGNHDPFVEISEVQIKHKDAK